MLIIYDASHSQKLLMNSSRERTTGMKKNSRNIEWELHYKSINKRKEHSYQVKLKFVLSQLPSGKMNFATKHTCSFYKIMEPSSTPHTNFFTI